MYGEDSETGAINNTLVIPSSLRLDGGLLVNSGALTLTNANLQKLQYCSTISSDNQTQTASNTTSISTLNTNMVLLVVKNVKKKLKKQLLIGLKIKHTVMQIIYKVEKSMLDDHQEKLNQIGHLIQIILFQKK
jgi:hypothetical protein